MGRQMPQESLSILPEGFSNLSELFSSLSHLIGNEIGEGACGGSGCINTFVHWVLSCWGTYLFDLWRTHNILNVSFSLSLRVVQLVSILPQRDILIGILFASWILWRQLRWWPVPHRSRECNWSLFFLHRGSIWLGRTRSCADSHVFRWIIPGHTIGKMREILFVLFFRAHRPGLLRNCDDNWCFFFQIAGIITAMRVLGPIGAIQFISEGVKTALRALGVIWVN